MGLEDLRRWQWAGIGLAAGLAFGGVRVANGPDLDSGIVRTLNDPGEFERLIARDPTQTPKINDVVVHPAGEDGMVWLTFIQTRQAGQRVDPNDPNSPRGMYNDRNRLVVKEPYTPASLAHSQARTDLTIREYLADLQRQFPDAEIRFKYAWWEIPKYTLALSAGIGLVLIGGVWPSVVGLLTGGGIWGPRRRAKAAYDLDRFSGGPDAARAGAAVASDEAKAELARLEDEMLAKLGGFGQPPDRDQDSVDEDAPAVRTLDGGRLESPDEAATRVEAEKKAYAGDFYPVARTGGKPDTEAEKLKLQAPSNGKVGKE